MSKQAQTNQKLKEKPPSPEVMGKALLDLCNKKQLTIQQIKQDQKDALNTLIKVQYIHR